jgi:phosphate transport system permease protein
MNENNNTPKLEFSDNVKQRNRSGKVWTGIFQFSTIVGIIALGTLLLNIINQSTGYVHYKAKVDPDTLSVNGISLENQSKEQLISVLRSSLSQGAYNKLEREKPFAERSRGEVYDLIFDRVVKYDVEETWQLWDSIANSAEIKASVPVDQSGTELRFVLWVNGDFLRRQQSSDPVLAGVRTAILGSLWTIGITILVAFPLGVMAAIYLEEYAADNWINRIIQTNINNLAGVPSIIYGILGLAIFVRLLEPFTSGAMFGLSDSTTANGRTLMSAGLTLALLVLPLIIINSQEAIRAVPGSLRNASYGIGATKWQTVWSWPACTAPRSNTCRCAATRR